VGFSGKAQEFISQLNELRAVVLERLLTTPLEVLQRKEYVEDVQSNTAAIDTASDNMRSDLAELAADTEQKVSRAPVHVVCQIDAASDNVCRDLSPSLLPIPITEQ